ncbi:16913_t:CDS:2 [Acaulospora colombiana]|uniref:16913_t:CDS:1 n=1 Tax=Acaulospora colombiana TaxID=27376 RepID=A0ACA9LLB0_9GLOM|nr:16913_t:CDS:2 [Acaulospora colombiana]
MISKRLNRRRYRPSTRTDMSPNTKNPPSEGLHRVNTGKEREATRFKRHHSAGKTPGGNGEIAIPGVTHKIGTHKVIRTLEEIPG